jgi:hypothetical protein
MLRAMVKTMLKKMLGVVSGFFALSSVMMTVMAIGDLIGGGSSTANSVLVALIVFFGGMAAFTGYGAVRLLRSPAEKTDEKTDGLADNRADAVVVGGIDIALEAKILGLASKSAGRLTSTEVALGCGVSIDAATAALDQLAGRGHADLAVTEDGATVYVVKGFLSVEEKQEAEALVG